MLEIICAIVIVVLIAFALAVAADCLFMAGVKTANRGTFEEVFPHVFVGIVFLSIAVTIIIMIT